MRSEVEGSRELEEAKADLEKERQRATDLALQIKGHEEALGKSQQDMEALKIELAASKATLPEPAQESEEQHTNKEFEELRVKSEMEATASKEALERSQKEIEEMKAKFQAELVASGEALRQAQKETEELRQKKESEELKLRAEITSTKEALAPVLKQIEDLKQTSANGLEYAVGEMKNQISTLKQSITEGKATAVETPAGFGVKKEVQVVEQGVTAINYSQLTVGQRVEARYAGKDQWYPGSIVAVHLHPDGGGLSYDIRYDDHCRIADLQNFEGLVSVFGQRENFVVRSLIRVINSEMESAGNSTHLNSSNLEGEKLTDIIGHHGPTVTEALELYRGTVRNAVLEPQDNNTGLIVGAQVEARYGGKDQWYPGTIIAVHLHPEGGSSSYDIRYDDHSQVADLEKFGAILSVFGERENFVSRSLIRVLPSEVSVHLPEDESRAEVVLGSIETEEEKEVEKMSESLPLGGDAQADGDRARAGAQETGARAPSTATVDLSQGAEQQGAPREDPNEEGLEGPDEPMGP